MLDVFGDQDENVAGLIADADPAAAAVVTGWLDTAAAIGRTAARDGAAAG